VGTGGVIDPVPDLPALGVTGQGRHGSLFPSRRAGQSR
jgi:hypothetical protein